ncbi:uncharacterized protein LOC128644688 [Bombina bombina]|uniref:uncharacterized protein LOC128644688 n=1 Tax=Bombina bombina TaxID=8345 RepID=UPI00235AC455|nr:uncharacterized protein LOC128644688 [Bombina bombina]
MVVSAAFNALSLPAKRKVKHCYPSQWSSTLLDDFDRISADEVDSDSSADALMGRNLRLLDLMSQSSVLENGEHHSVETHVSKQSEDGLSDLLLLPPCETTNQLAFNEQFVVSEQLTDAVREGSFLDFSESTEKHPTECVPQNKASEPVNTEDTVHKGSFLGFTESTEIHSSEFLPQHKTEPSKTGEPGQGSAEETWLTNSYLNQEEAESQSGETSEKTTDTLGDSPSDELIRYSSMTHCDPSSDIWQPTAAEQIALSPHYPTENEVSTESQQKTEFLHCDAPEPGGALVTENEPSLETDTLHSEDKYTDSSGSAKDGKVPDAQNLYLAEESESSLSQPEHSALGHSGETVELNARCNCLISNH